MKLVLGADRAGIEDVRVNSPWNIRVDNDIHYITGDGLSKIDELVIISVDGRRVFSTTSVTPAGIPVRLLAPAVYCVCLRSEG